MSPTGRALQLRDAFPAEPIEAEHGISILRAAKGLQIPENAVLLVDRLVDTKFFFFEIFFPVVVEQSRQIQIVVGQFLLRTVNAIAERQKHGPLAVRGPVVGPIHLCHAGNI